MLDHTNDQIISTTPNPKVNDSILGTDMSRFDEVQVVVDNLKYDYHNAETQIEEKNKQMKCLLDSYMKMKQDYFMVDKEQELFTQEINSLQEAIKDINWKINKDYCNKFLSANKTDKPSSIVVNLCEIFCYTLNLKDTSWNSFKELLKNFSKLKHLMSNFSEDSLNDEQIIKLMDLWKSSESLDIKLQQKNPEAQLIMKWLIKLLELKFKSRAFMNSREKQKTIDDEMTKINSRIKDVNSEILTLKMNMKKLKYSLETVNDGVSQSNKKLNIVDSGNKIAEKNQNKQNILIQNKKPVILRNRVESDIHRGDIRYIELENKIINKNSSNINNPLSLGNFTKNVVKSPISNINTHNDSTFDYNQSYELDEKTPVIPINNRDKDSKDQSNHMLIQQDYIVSAIKQIKIDPPTFDKANKPLPNPLRGSFVNSQSSYNYSRKQTNKEKKIINELPCFTTKNNQNVLSDNNSTASVYSTNTLSSNYKSGGRRNSIEMGSWNSSIHNNHQDNKDNNSELSKNLMFSPNNSVLRRSIVSIEDSPLMNFDTNSGHYNTNNSNVNSNAFRINNKNKGLILEKHKKQVSYTCNKKMSNLFC